MRMRLPSSAAKLLSDLVEHFYFESSNVMMGGDSTESAPTSASSLKGKVFVLCEYKAPAKYCLPVSKFFNEASICFIWELYWQC